MLSKSDVLAAIDLDVDYIGAASSVEEHGITLIPVNKYALCAEKLMDLPQSEWWPFTHCMFSIQKCMNYVSKEEAGFSSCDEAGRPRPFIPFKKGASFPGRRGSSSEGLLRDGPLSSPREVKVTAAISAACRYTSRFGPSVGRAASVDRPTFPRL